MALARIITRSQMCSRELSLVLRARGYTVEIVSPDKVPDNIADLELRVEAGPANELIANVEAHNGGHTSSLEFVHHLKAPVLDFPRRPSEPGEAAHTSGEPVSFIARPVNEDRALPAEASQPSLRAVPPAVESLPYCKANPEVDPAESTCSMAPQSLVPPEAPPTYFAVKDAAALQPAPTLRTIGPQTTIPRIMDRKTMVPPTQAAQPRNHSAGWPWRAGLAFAIVMLLSIVLGLGMRGNTKAAAQSPELSPGRKIAAAAGGNPSNAVGTENDIAIDPEQIQAVPWGLLGADMEANSGRAPKEAQVLKSETPTTSPRTAVSRKRGDDLIARDTTVYFDKRFEPAPKSKRAKPIADRREHH